MSYSEFTKAEVYERELEKEYIHQVDVYMGFFKIKTAIMVIGMVQLVLFLASLIQSIQYQFLNEFMPMITWQGITSMIFILHRFRTKDSVEWRTLYFGSYMIFDCFLVKLYKLLLLNSIVYDWPAQVCKHTDYGLQNCKDMIGDIGTISLPFMWAIDLYFLYILKRYRNMKENEEVNRLYL